MLFTSNALKTTSFKIIQAKRSFVKCGDWFTRISHFELCNRVSLNNETNCREISKDKIAVCEKTAGLRSGNSSDLDSACLKALAPVEIFQFSDMHYESRFLDTFRGHNIRPNIGGHGIWKCVDDTTTSEIVPRDATRNAQNIARNIAMFWSSESPLQRIKNLLRW